MLYGREDELAQIDRLLDRARSGRSATLLVRGETGIGKSALLQEAERRATGFLILRCTGVEAEAELPFAGLHLLLRPYLDRIDALPAPQAAALRGAFGMARTATADRFLVGLATLTLLAELAERQPVLCLIDDAQWIDRGSADALQFAARRLEAEAIVCLVAVRDTLPAAQPGPVPSPGPQLQLTGLDDAAAEALLADSSHDLAPAVRRRLVEDSAGNPLALLEFAAVLSDEHHLVPVPTSAPPGASRVQDAFGAQVAALPTATRTALLVAAADGSGDLALVLQAAGTFGAGLADLEPAERAGLIRLHTGRLDFRHPLIRAAVYGQSLASDRIAAHRALADTLTGPELADRRAWHRAAASTGPDDQVARELEAAADRARQRGGYAASSAAYERAGRLTADPAARGRRLAGAADDARDAGQLARAAALAGEAAELRVDAATSARIAGVRARVEFEHGTPRRASELNIAGARAIAETDPHEAARMLIEAVRMAYFADRVPNIREAVEVGSTLQLPIEDPLGPFIAATIVVARMMTVEPTQAIPRLHRIAARIPFGQLSGESDKLRMHAASLQLLAGEAGDIVQPARVATAAARERGMIGGLPHLLLIAAEAALACGRLQEALSAGTEGLQIAQDTGQEHSATNLRSVLARIAAMTGDEERCIDYAEAAMRYAAVHHTGANMAMAALALAVQDLGQARYAAAYDHLDRLTPALPNHLLCSMMTPPETIEAAARSGRPELGAEPLRRYEAWTGRHRNHPLGRAIIHRCRALLSPDDAADEHYQNALRVHRETDRPLAQARTELLYGEWLRRGHRRSEARDHLRSALRTFELAGARPWADRARSELRAAGETTTAAGDRSDLLARLTPQELQVARLAASGLSNRDIGAQLFLSPRTVGYHLYKAFPKLGISGRGDLARMNLD